MKCSRFMNAKAGGLIFIKKIKKKSKYTKIERSHIYLIITPTN